MDNDLHTLDEMINIYINNDKHNIEKEKSRLTYKDCHVLYNSVNVLCGRQGSG